MSDLHKIRITGGPDPESIEIHLDGRQLRASRVDVNLQWDKLATVVVEFEACECDIDIEADVCMEKDRSDA